MIRRPAMRVAHVDWILWAIVQRAPITWEAIATRFAVSRATAYRWLAALEDARQRAQMMDIPHPARRRTPSAADTEARAQ